MSKNPAFSFYASDWLGSTNHKLMTPAERGAYIDLLCYQWGDETCSLPADPSILARLSGLDEGYLNNQHKILQACFPPHPTLPNRVANPRMLKIQKEREEWTEKCRLGGIASGKTRREQAKSTQADEPKGSSTVVEEYLNTPSSSSSSSSSPSSSPSPPPEEERSAACPPQGLLDLIDGWSKLGNSIVATGNGVTVNKPSKVLKAAWKRTKLDKQLREAVSDVPALMAAIRKATFCHKQGWFTPVWLLSKNKNGELNSERILAGAHDEHGNKIPQLRTSGHDPQKPVTSL